jgi:hypothetical protein
MPPVLAPDHIVDTFEQCLREGYERLPSGKHGPSVFAEVARRLETPVHGLHGRLQRAERAYRPVDWYFGSDPALVPEGEYTAPSLPDDDETPEETLGRLVAEQDRREAYRAATEWMPFEVKGKQPFGLVFVGDPHLDVCDARTLQHHLSVIEQTPRMWAVGLGDWLNGWVGKLRGQYAHQSVTEKQAYALARAVLMRDIWWLLILGNHDGERWQGQGGALRWMENAAPVPIQEWQVKFSVKCGDSQWKIWAAHDFPGVSMWNNLHAPNKRAQMTGAVADLYICGDHHVYGVAESQHEHTGRPYWVARARGYKTLDHYALEKGYGNMTMGHSIAAIFDPKTGKMTCFGNIDTAASYLKFLCNNK